MRKINYNKIKLQISIIYLGKKLRFILFLLNYEIEIIFFIFSKFNDYSISDFVMLLINE